MERVKTGVPGFDELVQGGIPKSSSCLVCGGSGCGKTIFAMEFIYKGAKDYEEPGLFVTLETNLKNIVWNMQNFQWDIRSLQERNLMRIYRLNLTDVQTEAEMEKRIEEELKMITKIVEEIGAKRIAIDTINTFGVWFENRGKMRSLLFKFTDELKNLDCTTLLTSETSGEKKDFSGLGVEEFVVDGVIALYFTPPNRSVFVKKMRGTDQSPYIHPFKITAQGITVNPKDRVMWESLK